MQMRQLSANMKSVVDFKHFKVALSFQIDKFHKQNILRNSHTYIIINASNEGIFVGFERKNKTTFFFYFQIAGK